MVSPFSTTLVVAGEVWGNNEVEVELEPDYEHCLLSRPRFRRDRESSPRIQYTARSVIAPTRDTLYLDACAFAVLRQPLTRLRI